MIVVVWVRENQIEMRGVKHHRQYDAHVQCKICKSSMGIGWYEVHYIFWNYEEIDKHMLTNMLYSIFCKTYTQTYFL